MKTPYLIFSLFCALFIIICCKKSDKEQSSLAIQTKVETRFQKCDCALNSIEYEPEYIKAELNGIAMCFDVAPNFDSNFANMFKYGTLYRYNEVIYYDNTHLIRNAKNSPWQLAIFLENTHALTKTYPYNLPRANPEVCEIGEFQINYNYGTQFSNPFFGNGMKLTVTSFNNHFFEGTFSGVASSKTGEAIKVTNGKFRIKLALEKRDIIIK